MREDGSNETLSVQLRNQKRKRNYNCDHQDVKETCEESKSESRVIDAEAEADDEDEDQVFNHKCKQKRESSEGGAGTKLLIREHENIHNDKHKDTTRENKISSEETKQQRHGHSSDGIGVADSPKSDEDEDDHDQLALHRVSIDHSKK